MLDLLAEPKAQHFERCHLVGVVLKLTIDPAAGKENDAATFEHPTRGAGPGGKQAEPREHIVELVTVGCEAVTDRV